MLQAGEDAVEHAMSQEAVLGQLPAATPARGEHAVHTQTGPSLRGTPAACGHDSPAPTPACYSPASSLLIAASPAGGPHPTLHEQIAVKHFGVAISAGGLLLWQAIAGKS